MGYGVVKAPGRNSFSSPYSVPNKTRPINPNKPESVPASSECVPKRTTFFQQVPAQYNFDWAVVDDYSGNNYGHQESRDGYNTQGSYYVQLPDGRLQKVTYYVDGDSGYVAEVTYEGQAQYPAYQPVPSYRPAPTYTPAPVYG